MTINEKNRVRATVAKAVMYCFLVLIAVILLYPYGFMLNRGLMTNEWILDSYMHYWTDGFRFMNYVEAFGDGG